MTACASPAELLLCALTESRPSAAETADHVRQCASCDARVHELSARISRMPTSPSDHLDEFSFAEVAGATNEREIRDEAVAHLSSCEECRAALSEIASVMRDPFVCAELEREGSLSIVAEGARSDRTSSMRRPHINAGRAAIAGLAVAAAALLMVRLYPKQSSGVESSTAIRHATIDAARAPRPVAPLGDVGRVGAMTWTSVPHADRYRVSIFDSGGQVVWETEVTDTTANPPNELLAHKAGDLRWRVKARTSFDRWIDSDFAEFSLRGDR
jgi:hypothetical protein